MGRIRALKFALLIGVTAVIVVLDQWTKAGIIAHFNLGDSIPVWRDFFSITYVRNTGAAFGILSNLDPTIRTPFFYTVPTLALAVIGWIYFRLDHEDKILRWSLSCVVGGAVGNFIDRVRFGYVIDFLDFHYKNQKHFPAFNVADMAISLGVILMFIDLFFKSSASARSGDQNKES